METLVEQSHQANQQSNYCPVDYCTGPPETAMMAQCSDRGCSDFPSSPGYEIGCTLVSMQIYYHLSDQGETCLPCCRQSSKHGKIPSEFIFVENIPIFFISSC